MIQSKVAREKESFELEDTVLKGIIHNELLAMKPQLRSLHPRMAKELKTSITDGKMRDTIAQAEVPNVSMKHVQLSVNLEMLRTNWRGVKKSSGATALKSKALNEFALRYVSGSCDARITHGS